MVVTIVKDILNNYYLSVYVSGSFYFSALIVPIINYNSWFTVKISPILDVFNLYLINCKYK